MSNNQVSLAGEFAVLSQLFFRGFDASLTLGNTKGVDILVSNPNDDQVFKIEVKTRTGIKSSTTKSQWGPMYQWRMNEKHEKIKDDNLFYCFVLMQKDDKNNIVSKYFIVPSKVVADYVTDEHKWWLRQKKRKDITNRTFRLGIEDNFKYPVETPLVSEYENNWYIFR